MVVAALLAFVLWKRAAEFLELALLTLPSAAARAGDWATMFVMMIGLGMSAIGAAELLVTRWQFLRGLRMTPDELRQELAREEGGRSGRPPLVGRAAARIGSKAGTPPFQSQRHASHERS
jgi:flagellar biosynthesis protein FlhB